MSPAAQWMSLRSRHQSRPPADGDSGSGDGELHPWLERERKRGDKLRALSARTLAEDPDEIIGVVPAPVPRSASPANLWT